MTISQLLSRWLLSQAFVYFVHSIILALLLAFLRRASHLDFDQPLPTFETAEGCLYTATKPQVRACFCQKLMRVCWCVSVLQHASWVGLIVTGAACLIGTCRAPAAHCRLRDILCLISFGHMPPSLRARSESGNEWDANICLLSILYIVVSEESDQERLFT